MTLQAAVATFAELHGARRYTATGTPAAAQATTQGSRSRAAPPGRADTGSGAGRIGYSDNS